MLVIFLYMLILSILETKLANLKGHWPAKKQIKVVQNKLQKGLFCLTVYILFKHSLIIKTNTPFLIWYVNLVLLFYMMHETFCMMFFYQKCKNSYLNWKKNMGLFRQWKSERKWMWEIIKKKKNFFSDHFLSCIWLERTKKLNSIVSTFFLFSCVGKWLWRNFP